MIILKKSKLLIFFIVGLTACQPKSLDENSAKTSESSKNGDAKIVYSQQNSQQPINIDWKKIDTGITPADTKNYPYPFALDSQQVKAYAEHYGVDKKTAQHNLTIGMASNEALSKVLDQLEMNYVSHQLTSGKNSQLKIFTTDNVMPSQYNYVFAEDFAKGLILPIEIVPQKSAKTQSK